VHLPALTMATLQLALARAARPAISTRVVRGVRAAARGTVLWIQRWLACGLEATVQMLLFWH
jgi:hypothetical protein